MCEIMPWMQEKRRKERPAVARHTATPHGHFRATPLAGICTPAPVAELRLASPTLHFHRLLLHLGQLSRTSCPLERAIAGCLTQPARSHYGNRTSSTLCSDVIPPQFAMFWRLAIITRVGSKYSETRIISAAANLHTLIMVKPPRAPSVRDHCITHRDIVENMHTVNDHYRHFDLTACLQCCRPG